MLNNNNINLLIEEALENVMLKLSKPNDSKFDKLIPRKVLTEKLGVTEQTITQWKKSGKIKSYSIGRYDYFDKDEIFNSMKGGIK